MSFSMTQACKYSKEIMIIACDCLCVFPYVMLLKVVDIVKNNLLFVGKL